MTQSVRVVDIFKSFEGEGPYTGVPTMFVRMFGCNFTCSGFQNHGIRSRLEHEDKSLGCDTSYAWSKNSINDSVSYTVAQMTEHLCKTDLWATPILCFTGGEPLLHQAWLTEFFNSGFNLCKHILIETNGTISLNSSFYKAIRKWLATDDQRQVTFSVSPKLSNSGEPFDKAIKPEPYKRLYSEFLGYNVVRYLKFVVNPNNNKMFDELLKIIPLYGIGYTPQSSIAQYPDRTVWIMPEGSTVEQLSLTSRDVADFCVRHNYNFCYRTHIGIYGKERRK